MRPKSATTRGASLSSSRSRRSCRSTKSTETSTARTPKRAASGWDPLATSSSRSKRTPASPASASATGEPGPSPPSPRRRSRRSSSAKTRPSANSSGSRCTARRCRSVGRVLPSWQSARSIKRCGTSQARKLTSRCTNCSAARPKPRFPPTHRTSTPSTWRHSSARLRSTPRPGSTR